MTTTPLIRIVDDDPEVRDSLKLMLECEGWEVKAYADGRAFLQDLEGFYLSKSLDTLFLTGGRT